MSEPSYTLNVRVWILGDDEPLERFDAFLVEAREIAERYGCSVRWTQSIRDSKGRPRFQRGRFRAEAA